MFVYRVSEQIIENTTAERLEDVLSSNFYIVLRGSLSNLFFLRRSIYDFSTVQFNNYCQTRRFQLNVFENIVCLVHNDHIGFFGKRFREEERPKSYRKINGVMYVSHTLSAGI